MQCDCKSVTCWKCPNPSSKYQGAIIVWPFDSAPEQYRILSDNGGDEDWLAFVPNEIVNTHFYISWLDGTQFSACGEPQIIDVEGGKVYIGSHS